MSRLPAHPPTSSHQTRVLDLWQRRVPILFTSLVAVACFALISLFAGRVQFTNHLFHTCLRSCNPYVPGGGVVDFHYKNQSDNSLFVCAAAATSRVTRNSSRRALPSLTPAVPSRLLTPPGFRFPSPAASPVPIVPLPIVPDPDDYYLDMDANTSNPARWHWSSRREFAQAHVDSCKSTMKRYAAETEEELESRRLAQFIRDAGFSTDERRRFNAITHFAAVPADAWDLGNVAYHRTGRANASTQHKIIAWAKVHGIMPKDKSEAKAHLRQGQAYLYQASQEVEPWITTLYDVCDVAEASPAEVQEYVIQFASAVLPENMSSERSIQKIAAAEFSNDPGVAPTTRQAMKDRLMQYEAEIDRLARSAVYNNAAGYIVPNQKAKTGRGVSHVFTHEQYEAMDRKLNQKIAALGLCENIDEDGDAGVLDDHFPDSSPAQAPPPRWEFDESKSALGQSRAVRYADRKPPVDMEARFAASEARLDSLEAGQVELKKETAEIKQNMVTQEQPSSELSKQTDRFESIIKASIASITSEVSTAVKADIKKESQERWEKNKARREAGRNKAMQDRPCSKCGKRGHWANEDKCRPEDIEAFTGAHNHLRCPLHSDSATQTNSDSLLPLVQPFRTSEQKMDESNSVSPSQFIAAIQIMNTLNAAQHSLPTHQYECPLKIPQHDQGAMPQQPDAATDMSAMPSVNQVVRFGTYREESMKGPQPTPLPVIAPNDTLLGCADNSTTALDPCATPFSPRKDHDSMYISDDASSLNPNWQLHDTNEGSGYQECILAQHLWANDTATEERGQSTNSRSTSAGFTIDTDSSNLTHKPPQDQERHTGSGTPSLFPPTEGEDDQVEVSEDDVMALTDVAAEDWYDAMKVPKEMQDELTPFLGSNEGRASQTMSVRDTAENSIQEYDADYDHSQSCQSILMKQHSKWGKIKELMKRRPSPNVLLRNAWQAVCETAGALNRRPQDVVEAVLRKIRARTPRVFSKPQKPYDGEDSDVDLAEAQKDWKKQKEMCKEHTHEVTGLFASAELAIQNGDRDYQMRIDAKDPMVTATTTDAIKGTSDEIEELRTELQGVEVQSKCDKGKTFTMIDENKVIDECGDSIYGVYWAYGNAYNIEMQSDVELEAAFVEAAVQYLNEQNEEYHDADATSVESCTAFIESDAEPEAEGRIDYATMAVKKPKQNKKGFDFRDTSVESILCRVREANPAASRANEYQNRATLRKMIANARISNSLLQSLTKDAAARRKKVKHTRSHDPGGMCGSFNRWKLQVRKATKQKREVAALRFRSVLVQIEVQHGDRWIEAVAIADTGSGPNVFRIVDVTSENAKLMQPPSKCTTADGSILKSLVGKGKINFRFAGSPNIHEVEAEISDAPSATRIVGMDFWGEKKATFDFSNDTITIVNDDGTSEAIPCTKCGSSAKYNRRARPSQQTAPQVAYVSDESPIHCVAADDIVLTPGEKPDCAFEIELDCDASHLHCGDILDVASEELATTGSWHGADITVHEKEAVEASLDWSLQQELVRPVCPIIVRPDLSNEAFKPTIKVGLANPGVNTLVIRKGQKIATARPISPDDVRLSPTATEQGNDFQKLIASVLKPQATEDATEDDPSTVSMGTQTNNGPTNKANTTAAQCEHATPWMREIDNLSGREIIALIRAGRIVNGWTMEEWMADVGDHLKFGPRILEQDKDDLCCLLYALQDVVAKDPKKPGQFSNTEMEIHLNDPNTEPVKCNWKRYSPAEREIIREETQAMLDKGIIEYSDSPWCAPVVLVKKKDGTWRFCVNFTATCNPLIRKNSAPLPKVADIFESLSKATTLSLWDVTSGFWSCKIREQDRQYTAFGTDSHGLCQFRVAPFGLATSGAFFQQAIERVLKRDEDGPILHKTAEVFVDDGTVHTDKTQDHINELARVLKQLWRNNVTIKMKKCIWGTDEVTLLGHNVKCELGTEPDIDKVAHILALKRLNTIGELRSLLGSTVYLSGFVKDYADLTGPLYDLLSLYKSPDTPLHEGEKKWNDTHELALQGIKAALGTAPVLAFPDFSKPFIVVCDCSKTQLGGVLIQIADDGTERIIAYFSQRLNKTQQSYGISSKEGLAVIMCLRKWRCYVHSHPTICVTDHKALVHLTKAKEFSTDRLKRYSAELMEYSGDLLFAYRPGRLLDIADLMSRAEIEQDPKERLRMAQELLEWKAKSNLIEAEDLQRMRNQKVKVKDDDMVGESSCVHDKPPWAASRGKLALQAETAKRAYDKGEMQKQIKMLLHGAQVQMAPADSKEDLLKTVEKITDEMNSGVYQSGVKKAQHDPEEEDPLIIQMYDMVSAISDQQTAMPSIQEIAAAQKEDEFCKAVKHDLNLSGKDKAKRELKHLFTKELEQYVVEDGILRQLQTTRDGTTAKVVVPLSMQTQLIQAIHCSWELAHAGAARTFAEIQKSFVFEQMRRKVFDVVALCDICGRFGNRPRKNKHGLHLDSETPGEFWVADVQYMPEDDEGYSIMLTMVDVCSRWSIAAPIRGKAPTSERIAQALNEEWSKLGPAINARRLSHDGGAEFKKIVADVCHLLRVKRHISEAGRPQGHGIIEKWNKDVVQLIAKMCPTGKIDKEWRKVLPFACEAKNNAVFSPTVQGSEGISPAEVLLGIQPRVSNVPDSVYQDKSLKHADPGSREHLKIIAEAKRKAVDYIKVQKEAYYEMMDKTIQNQLRQEKEFYPGEVVRHALHYKERMEKKSSPSYSDRMVVIADAGFNRYHLQPYGQCDAELVEKHADDIKSDPVFSKVVAEAAEKQALDALELLVEYEIEAILEEKGYATKGTKEYLVKWVGYPDCTWEPASSFDHNCLPLQEFKSKKKKGPASSTSFIERMTAALCGTGRIDETIQLDILDQNLKDDIIQIVAAKAGIDPSRILVVHESPPCETFTNTSHSNRGRVTAKIPTGHGFNFRNDDDERSPCCETGVQCKYAETARLHDQFVPALLASYHKDCRRGLNYFCDIENVDGDLKRRPYMDAVKNERMQPFAYTPFHGCAFNHPTKAKKPYSFWTTNKEYKPTGTTGDGQCGSQCENGFWNERQQWEHYGKLGRQPKDGPRGPGAIKIKNAIPPLFITEYLTHCYDRREHDSQDIVIDLCCGWQSFRPVCEELGLGYVGVDIRGDRNLKLPKAARKMEEQNESTK